MEKLVYGKSDGSREIADLVRYRCVDREHNVWQCDCGHLARFEADGAPENGWDYCPHCGGVIRQVEEGDTHELG